MLTTILSFLAVLGVLIFIHELGHYLAARHVGVRVEAFSIGFPPTAFPGCLLEVTLNCTGRT